MRSVRLLSAIVAIDTFLVIVFGKIVRVTGASASIPDWPLAFGQLVPKMTPLVFWEWSHRLLALVALVATLVLVACAGRVSARLCLYCSVSMLVLVATALIGGLSILHPLHWVWAAVDQALAMLFFASMVGLAVWSRMTGITSTPSGSADI